MHGKQQRQIIRIAVLVFLSSTLLASDGDTKLSVPPHVFVDVGGCPVECCRYGEWVVEEKTIVSDQPNGKRVLNTLSKGDFVTALKGEVISKPIATKADRDIPETPIKTGDTFYVLHYEGEGYWKVWFRGKTTHAPDYGRSDFPRPKAEWWVKIKDAHGQIGWVLQHGNFSPQHSSDKDVCE